jgi:hypothetical protein
MIDAPQASDLIVAVETVPLRKNVLAELRIGAPSTPGSATTG